MSIVSMRAPSVIPFLSIPRREAFPPSERRSHERAGPLPPVVRASVGTRRADFSDPRSHGSHSDISAAMKSPIASLKTRTLYSPVSAMSARRCSIRVRRASDARVTGSARPFGFASSSSVMRDSVKHLRRGLFVAERKSVIKSIARGVVRAAAILAHRTARHVPEAAHVIARACLLDQPW
jgi:hypothetical protein